MTEQQYAALIAVLGRIAQALEAQAEPEDEKLTFPLSDYATFDWAGIGATVVQRDADGVSVIRAANGKMCKRRSNDKFGTEIWFSSCTGKGADGTPTYARVIEFRQVQPPEPLGRKTEQAVKAAINGKPATPSENPHSSAPSDPPPLYDRLVAAQRAIVGAGKVVPYYLMPSRDDSQAAMERNVLALERLAAEAVLPAEVVEARHAIERLHNEAKSLDMQLDPTMTDLNGDVTLLGMRVSTLRRLIDAHRATIGRAVYPPAAQANGHTEGIAVKVEPPTPAAPLQPGIPLSGGPAPATPALVALRDRLNELAAECNGRKQRAPANARQDIAVLLNTMCGNSEKRKLFLVAVAGRDSLELIGDAMLCALFRWLKPARDGAHLVSANATAAAEIEAAMRQPEAPSS